MFSYWKSECRNRYSIDRLDAIELMASPAAAAVVVAVAEAVAAAAVVAFVVVSAQWINAKLNTQIEMKQTVFYFPVCTHAHTHTIDIDDIHDDVCMIEFKQSDCVVRVI